MPCYSAYVAGGKERNFFPDSFSVLNELVSVSVLVLLMNVDVISTSGERRPTGNFRHADQDRKQGRRCLYIASKNI